MLVNYYGYDVVLPTSTGTLLIELSCASLTQPAKPAIKWAQSPIANGLESQPPSEDCLPKSSPCCRIRPKSSREKLIIRVYTAYQLFGLFEFVFAA